MQEVPELGSDAELRELGQIRCASRREGNMHEDGESDVRELEETEEGSQISQRRGKSDVGDEMKVDAHVDSDRAKGPERKSAG